MFRNPANPLIRVAVFPVLLLFWQHVFGTDLPLLAPAMCAVFLTTTHNPPPLIMVFLMGGVLFATAWVQGALSHLLGHHPLVYYLSLFCVFYWCMLRTHKNAQDLLAILLVVSTAMIAVFSRQKGIDVSAIPMALLSNIFVAGFTAYLAYLLFPGGTPLAQPAAAGESQTLNNAFWQVLFKAVIVIITLICTINLDLTQSTIITIVVALIIKDPDPVIGHQYGVRRLLTTYASLLFALPPMVLSIFQTNLIALVGITLVCSLLMGIEAMKKRASFNGIQLMYSSFVVLVYYGITESSLNALWQDLIRFGSMVFAVVLGVMILIVIQPSPRPQR